MPKHPQTIALLLFFTCLLCTATSAEEPPVSGSTTVAGETDAPGADGDENKECTWSCLRWGKMCNIDPRGVYRCRRTCDRFGEICE